MEWQGFIEGVLLAAMLVFVDAFKMNNSWVSELDYPPTETECPISQNMTNAATDTNVINLGDMVLTCDQFEYFFEERERKGTKTPTELWPREGDHPTVPYTINYVDRRFETIIIASLKHVERYTCIKFRRERRDDRYSLRFTGGSVCSSLVGRRYRRQPIRLGRGCRKTWMVLHEIGHSLGLIHEFMRSDRDEYIDVIWGNIPTGRTRRNFYKANKWKFDSYGVPFDYTSIMMYDWDSFTRNGRITIRSKDPMILGIMGKSKTLSHRDKVVLNTMYECNEDWLKKCNLSATLCKNEGYVGKTCKCICPPHYTGDNCQDKVGDGGYYDHLFPACNQVITEGGTNIASPILPRRGSTCVFQIKAAGNQRINITFEDFLLDEDRKCRRAGLIFMEYKSEMSSGTMVCGKMERNSYYVSTTNELTLFFFVSRRSKKTRGFNAVVDFVPGDQVIGKVTGKIVQGYNNYFGTIGDLDTVNGGTNLNWIQILPLLLVITLALLKLVV